VSETQHDSDNYCYRHPDRQSYILCQRCGRTVCPQCSTQAAVGVHCPECVKEARQSAPRRKPRIVTAFRRSSDTPVVSYTLIGINLVVYALQWLLSPLIIQTFAFAPYTAAVEPWRMLTSTFLHSEYSIFHIVLNMFSLFVLGPALEHQLGRARFLALYLLAGFGGSLAVLMISAPDSGVVGASGAIFGLLGAYFVIIRRMGGNATQLVIVIGLNLVIGFFVGGISWEAHVGGLLAGAGVAFILQQTRRVNQSRVQVFALIGYAVVLIALAVITTVVRGFA
jgi:membrane associated rhomboid family serine protease